MFWLNKNTTLLSTREISCIFIFHFVVLVIKIKFQTIFLYDYCFFTYFKIKKKIKFYKTSIGKYIFKIILLLLLIEKLCNRSVHRTGTLLMKTLTLLNYSQSFITHSFDHFVIFLVIKLNGYYLCAIIFGTATVKFSLQLVTRQN